MQNRPWLLVAAFLLAAPFICSRAGRDIVSAFEFGSGNRKNRRQRDANRNADQRDRQFRDGDHRRGNRAQSAAHFAGRSPNCARPEHRPNRRSGRQDIRLHARQQLESHQSVDRRNRCQRSEPGRRVRFRAGPHLGHCASRSAARSAKQLVRIGRDRRRGKYRDEKRERVRLSSPDAWKAVRSIPSIKARAQRGSISRFNYSFNVAHFLADDTPVTPLDLLPPGRKRINDSYENTTVSTKLGVDLTDAFGLDAVARYTDSTLFFTGEDFSFFPSVPAAGPKRAACAAVFHARPGPPRALRWRIQEHDRASVTRTIAPKTSARYWFWPSSAEPESRRPHQIGLVRQHRLRGTTSFSCLGSKT